MKTKLIKAVLFSTLAPLFVSANLVYGQGSYSDASNAMDQDEQMREEDRLVDQIWLQNDLIQSLDEAHQAVFNVLQAGVYDVPEKMEERIKARKGHGQGFGIGTKILEVKANRSEVDKLHSKFVHALAEYKPSGMSWEDFDPISSVYSNIDVNTLKRLLNKTESVFKNLESIQDEYVKAVIEYSASANIPFKHQHQKWGDRKAWERGHGKKRGHVDGMPYGQWKKQQRNKNW